MPRIKQPHTPPITSSNDDTLQDCSIVFVSSQTSNITSNHEDLVQKSFDQLKVDIAACGGSVVGSVATATHLVATEEQFKKNGAKIKQASQRGIFIVNFNWLVDCLNSDGHADEANYSFVDDENENKEEAAESSKALPSVSSPADKEQLNKRARTDEPDDVQPASKKLKSTGFDTLVLSSKSTKKVPVDDFYMTQSDEDTACRVYQSAGVIYDATLNQTESGANANKFYRIQLLEYGTGLYRTWTRWGRVGAKGQTKLLGNGSLDSAIAEFESKFREKTGNIWEARDNFVPKSKKYALLEINYDSSDEDAEDNAVPSTRRASKDSSASSASSAPESNLPKAVANLMTFIFDQDYFDKNLTALNYDKEKMPLGKLSKKTLLQGYSVLKELAGLIWASSSNRPQITELSNRYFSLIPRDFGRDGHGRLLRPPILSTPDLVRKEAEVLESLTDMQLTDKIMKDAKANKLEEKIAMVDRQFQNLGLKEMTPLEPTSTEFRELADYLVKSSGQSHGAIRYNVQDIFRIERGAEGERFQKSSFSKLGPDQTDRALLWHGSRSTNFGGILSQGLRIAPPEAPASGYMFGKGVYLANMSTKSANYCASYLSGNQGLLLLCEAELGKPPLKLTNASYEAGEQAKAANCISTWGIGMTRPYGWKDAGCVHPCLGGVRMPDVGLPFGPSQVDGAYLMYDEFICYDVAQVKLRYLIRTGM